MTAAAKLDTRTNLIGLSRAELTDAVAGLGEKPFRARQLWHWIYHRGETDFAKMTTLAKSFRERLAENCEVSRPQVVTTQLSEDGTRKWLVRARDGNEVETVYIPEEDRGALCISSQVGCTLSCAFCHTGTQKLVRNLSAAEIVGQLMVARDTYAEWPPLRSWRSFGGHAPRSLGEGGRLITNIVMMGMGEPLYNYDAVAKALTIVMDDEGLAMSRRRITLSTSGVVPMIERVGEELGVGLAVSLHAVTDELRDVLVPINKKYPIAELLAACRTYPGAHNARRITFEYVMLKGVNDSPADAKQLAKLLKGIPAKVNLIPFNKWPGAEFECSEPETIQQFADILHHHGLTALVRSPRGRDIMAACGQLKSASERARRQRVDVQTDAG